MLFYRSILSFNGRFIVFALQMLRCKHLPNRFWIGYKCIPAFLGVFHRANKNNTNIFISYSCACTTLERSSLQEVDFYGAGQSKIGSDNVSRPDFWVRSGNATK